MDKIYTLFKNDSSKFAEEMVSQMEMISGSDVFNSKELWEYLDEFKVEVPDRLMQSIKNFRQRTICLQLTETEFTEITLN